MTTATTLVKGTVSKFEVQYMIQGLRSRGGLTRERTEQLTRKLEEIHPSDFSGLALVFSDTLLTLVPTDEPSKKLLEKAGELCFATIHGSDDRHTAISVVIEEFNNSL